MSDCQTLKMQIEAFLLFLLILGFAAWSLEKDLGAGMKLARRSL